MKNISLICAVLTLVLCQCQSDPVHELSKKEMFRIVKALGDQFSVGVQKKDSFLLTNIYSDSAQYVQPNRPILTGKTEIGKDWAGFLRMKENPIDLVLAADNVGGTREVIFETGTGYTLIADSTKWRFSYVNVWILQKDGTYKLEVDTYTPLDNVE